MHACADAWAERKPVAYRELRPSGVLIKRRARYLGRYIEGVDRLSHVVTEIKR